MYRVKEIHDIRKTYQPYNKTLTTWNPS